ncbi:hypothetical protein PAL_GLEAN10001892 [Pteropus alecto]|uniref:Uncharacterized protein n=1 Tax=Pteropus alecto TaxID=9402 RepID=L5KMF1_PTEAL|nr:hypothetical protein PAL_GLEAN10001892 [Pteropus alecto]
MGPRGAVAVTVGLWVLATVAADHGEAKPGRCLLSHYRSLDPRALEAVKALRDRYVSAAQTPASWARRGRRRRSLSGGALAS